MSTLTEATISQDPPVSIQDMPSSGMPSPDVTSTLADLYERPKVASELVDGVWYPYVDEGEPVAQGNFHSMICTELLNMLRLLLSSWPEAGIFGDIFIYWKRGDDSKKLAPDAIVIPRIRDKEKVARRKSTYLWREPSQPVFVLEVLSDETDQEDRGEKMAIYQDEWKVPEYFICDPLVEPTRVEGYRLVGDEYERLEADEQGRVWSEQLECWFGPRDDDQLQVWTAEGRALPAYAEAVGELELAIQQREEERRRAEDERQRADTESRLREASEARVRELEEELRRARGQSSE